MEKYKKIDLRKYRYSSAEGKAEWQSMRQRDDVWLKKAKEFYMEEVLKC